MKARLFPHIFIEERTDVLSCRFGPVSGVLDPRVFGRRHQHSVDVVVVGQTCRQQFFIPEWEKGRLCATVAYLSTVTQLPVTRDGEQFLHTRNRSVNPFQERS